MIFHNPAGAPELACDACGCRWFDRINNSCYECGTPVSDQMQAEFKAALEAFARHEEFADGTAAGSVPIDQSDS